MGPDIHCRPTSPQFHLCVFSASRNSRTPPSRVWLFSGSRRTLYIALCRWILSGPAPLGPIIRSKPPLRSLSSTLADISGIRPKTHLPHFLHRLYGLPNRMCPLAEHSQYPHISLPRRHLRRGAADKFWGIDSGHMGR